MPFERLTIKAQEALRAAPLAALIFSIGSVAWAANITVSASVDKTTVDIGAPIQLTIKLSGDVGGLQVPDLGLPEGWTVAARSQSSSFSVRGGAVERAVELLFVLVPHQAGTFQLGPFTFVRPEDKKEPQQVQTEPMTITVNKTAVPPALQAPQGGRFTL